MGRIVIVAMRPKPGQADALAALVAAHLPLLRAEGLATERPSTVMQATDGTVVEVFEWVSRAAIEAAHENAAVQKMWEAFYAVCDFVPLDTLTEASDLFSEFEAFSPAAPSPPEPSNPDGAD